MHETTSRAARRLRWWLVPIGVVITIAFATGVLLWFREEPVHYHSSVNGWSITTSGSRTRWQRGAVYYEDGDADGVIDLRYERRPGDFYEIISIDGNHDGLFEMEMHNDGAYPVEYRYSGHPRVPSTVAEPSGR